MQKTILEDRTSTAGFEAEPLVGGLGDNTLRTRSEE